MSRLYLVDVSSYIFRAFHAIPMLTTKDGLPTNAVLGVVNMLLKLVTEEKPERMAIVFDAGVPTEKVVEVMGLTGDSIDNIPGVKGIGDKTAQVLIQEFGSVEALLADLPRVDTLKIRGAKRIRELLEQGAETARLSRELARLKSDVSLEVTLDDLRMQAPDYLTLRTLFTELGFQSKIPLVAPREPTKSGTTGWIESLAEHELFAKTLAGKRRIAIEPIEG